MKPLNTDSLDVQVIVSPAYSNDYINIAPMTITFSIPLQDTDGIVITSDPIQIGSVMGLGNAALMATFSMWYAYTSARQTITLCAAELVSVDAAYITTWTDAYNEYCMQHTYSGDNSPCNNNPDWNYCTGSMPGLQQDLQNTACAINDAIFAAATNTPWLTVIRRTPPPPIPDELREKLFVVYRNGEYFGPHDATQTYGDEYTVIPVDSVWYGETYLHYAEAFANVIGSTSDPKVDRESWIALWRSQFGATGLCTSYQHAGNPNSPAPLQSFTCTASGTLFGGHVIPGMNSKDVPAGVDYVFIIPICPAHNNNDNVFMAALQCTKGIALQRYLQT